MQSNGQPNGAETGRKTPSQASQQMPPPPLPHQPSRTSLDRENGGGNNLQPPNGLGAARNLSSSFLSFAPRGSSLNPGVAPGSFSSEMRSQMMSSRAGSRMDLASNNYAMDKVDEDDDHMTQQALTSLKDRLNRELKIKEGSENMLEALNIKKAKQTRDQRLRVEAELLASNSRIKVLRQQISDTQLMRNRPATPSRSWTQETLQPPPQKSPGSDAGSQDGSDVDESTESPTFLLAELLQALEVEGMMPEYYVSRANALASLFKRHPTLKYDLVWSVFGMRMQMMLLSESREVVAAGYRVTRYAISDVQSLRKIRTLNTDFLVLRSLNNYRKADVEREQALKFVRAFLDVKDGVKEISRAIVRTIVAVAEQGDDRRSAVQPADHNIDRLRPICLETLAEILVRDPPLAVASGCLGPLTDALAEGSYKAPESLTSAFLFLLDTPQKRKYLQADYGLDALFTAFTDPLGTNEAMMAQSCKAISVAVRSWSGIMTLCMHDFRAVRSLVMSMLLPLQSIRESVLDLLFAILRIKPPAWAISFLAGRRLTTYGRVTNLKSGTSKKTSATLYDEESSDQNFVEHYTALILAVFIKADLLPCLLKIAQTEEDPMLKRKTTLMISEVLKLASRMLPASWSASLQLLPELFSAATEFGKDDHFVASGLVYQISSVSRTLYRSAPSESMAGILPSSETMKDLASLEGQPKASAAVLLDDATFRQLLIDSGVLNSSNYAKWNWEVIMKIIDGPLQSGKRLDEAIRASKFMKRLMSFYRPFKYKFSDIKSTRNTQKYVKAGCALMRSLLQSPEGVRLLADSKVVRQIAECLAQYDPTSGITAEFPLFERDRLTDTLCGGYFPMLGVLTGDPKGLQLLERWRMFNMMYHIVEMRERPDLIKLLLTSFDYTLQGHPRVLLSKALTSGTKDIRIYATDVLHKCTVRRPTSHNNTAFGDPSGSKWAIQLLVTQLYDPEIDVCAAAVKILEKACNRKAYLEHVVECRPSLDHLGEIGAPLLLRFLSTSIGYHYLDGLDYISNEMDDWFLGRNDKYVGVIEASLAKSFSSDLDEELSGRPASIFQDAAELLDQDFQDNQVPPHFYRELTRTKEGCKLLRDKGHFEEFASTIRDYGMQHEDTDLILKVKSCLWAVGNVGSMELGAPFLEDSDVVKNVVRIAEGHQVMSLRGTAFFVLGLISRSSHGLEMISEHGWDASTSPMGNSLGFCLPKDLGKLFSLEPWKHCPAASIVLPMSQRTIQEQPPLRKATPPLERTDISKLVTDEEINERILELLVDLGNTVLYKKALTELQKLKQRKPSAFKSTEFFKKVMGLMEWNHYLLGLRRIAIDLFEKNVMRQIVFDDESSEEEEVSEDEESEEEEEEEQEAQEEEEDDDDEEESEDEPQTAKPIETLRPRSWRPAPPPKDNKNKDHGSESESEESASSVSATASASGDDRTERQRSVSEPTELRQSLLPPPLKLGGEARNGSSRR